MITEATFPKKHKAVQQKVVDFYIHNKAPEKKDGIFYFRKYTQLLSDVMFNMPVINEARIKADNDWKVYLYLTTYINRDIFPKDIPVKSEFSYISIYRLYQIIF